MATAKDSMGNELKPGDKVMYKMAHGDSLICTVHEITQGSSVVPGGQMKMLRQGHQVQEIVTPGELRMIAQVMTELDPRNPVANNVVKVYDPEKENASGQAAPRKSGLLV